MSAVRSGLLAMKKVMEVQEGKLCRHGTCPSVHIDVGTALHCVQDASAVLFEHCWFWTSGLGSRRVGCGCWRLYFKRGYDLLD